jgi:hypothetical protein
MITNGKYKRRNKMKYSTAKKQQFFSFKGKFYSFPRSRKQIITIFIIFFMIYNNVTSLIVVAQSNPNYIDDENLIIKSGDEYTEYINENFDPGNINVKINLDTSYSTGQLYYNISNQIKIIKEGIIFHKVEFTFTYPEDGGFWTLVLKNKGNTSVKCNIYMNLPDLSNQITIYYIESCVLPIIVISVVIFAIVYIVKFKIKRYGER